MIPAKDDEPGQYRLLGTEGYDNDGDGRVNEDGDGYYDPNRDWAWHWQPRYVQRGAYRYPFSIAREPRGGRFRPGPPQHRRRAVVSQLGRHDPPRARAQGRDAFDPADVAVYDAIAKKGEQMLPGYRYLEIVDRTCTRSTAARWTGSTRCGASSASPTSCSRRSTTSASRPKAIDAPRNRSSRSTSTCCFGDGTVPWHEVDHPQYGKIEVGGLKKNWGRQPPSFLLEEECHRNMAFTLYHADQMPQVEIQSVDGEAAPRRADRGDGRGGQPRAHAHARGGRRANTRSPRPTWSRSKAKDLKVVARPLVRRSASSRKPASRSTGRSRSASPRIPGMGAVYVRWLVAGAGPYTVRVQSVKGGSDRRDIPPAGS